MLIDLHHNPRSVFAPLPTLRQGGRAIPGEQPGRVRTAINQFVYGRGTVACEECGTALAPHRAVWRGLHSYCSTGHEASDQA